MSKPQGTTAMGRLVADYGMVLALVLLCAFFSWRTMEVQHPQGAAAGDLVAQNIAKALGDKAGVLIVVTKGDEDSEFAEALVKTLKNNSIEPVAVVRGMPIDARKAIEKALAQGKKITAIACTHAVRQWPFFENIAEKLPALAGVQFFGPESYRWPNFLKIDNLVNVANQIAVIAIIAIGMTMIIITGGIDLSVGSLIALSAVVSALCISRYAGAESASALGMTLCCLGGIATCGAIGFFSGVMVSIFGIPPFIVTLSTMLVGSGLAYIVSQGQTIYQVPDTFVWLGRGTLLGGIPNSVALMIVLYILAHILMSRMTLGRYIYAVGGNREAARLSGVPVTAVLLLVYTFCGLLAGLGGVITASQLKSGSPNYGGMYELYVIAAVVVGGTSLSGGEGKIFGTLIGAFIIAVIQNGMNLTGLETYTQKVVLGLVILGAVLLDIIKKRTSFSSLFMSAGTGPA